MREFHHHKLRVYPLALDFIVSIDEVLEAWPPYRRYLVQQMRRAASSIALNITEGAHETMLKDKFKFYRYARRSAGECACVLDIAGRLGMSSPHTLEPYYNQLHTLIAVLTNMATPRR